MKPGYYLTKNNNFAIIHNKYFEVYSDLFAVWFKLHLPPPTYWENSYFIGDL